MITINEIRNKTRDVFIKYPINRVSVFGSYARGEQTDGSDVDFVIHDSSIGFLEMAGLREQLKSLLGTNIDLICDSDVSDVFKSIIKRDEVVIYEKQR